MYGISATVRPAAVLADFYQNLEIQPPRKVKAMFALVTYIVVVGTVLGFAGLALAVALGRTPDTTQSAKLWYPAGPAPEPWRAD